MISNQSLFTLFALFVWIYLFVAHADDDSTRRVRRVGSKNGSLVLMMEDGFIKAKVDCASRQPVDTHVDIPPMTQFPRFFTRTHLALRKVLIRKCIPDDVLVKGMSQGVRLGPFGGPMLMPIDSAIHFEQESDGTIVPTFRRSMELASDIRDMGWADDMMIIMDVPMNDEDMDVVLLMHVGAFLDSVADEMMDSVQLVGEIAHNCDWYSRHFYVNDSTHTIAHVCEYRKVYKLVAVERIELSPIQEYSQPPCPICLEEYNKVSDPSAVTQPCTNCGHCFHNKCMSIWKSSECITPLCQGVALPVNV